jgi:hypothetical protein
MNEDLEIKKMQIEYDIGAWRLQIMQNKKRILEAEKTIRLNREAIKELELKIYEKEEELTKL